MLKRCSGNIPANAARSCLSKRLRGDRRGRKELAERRSDGDRSTQLTLAAGSDGDERACSSRPTNNQTCCSISLSLSSTKCVPTVVCRNARHISWVSRDQSDVWRGASTAEVLDVSRLPSRSLAIATERAGGGCRKTTGLIWAKSNGRALGFERRDSR